MENLVVLNENELLTINGGDWPTVLQQAWDNFMAGFVGSQENC